MAWPQSREFFFSWKTDFLGYCSHEGQIHSSGSSSVFAQHVKEESRGLQVCLVISNNSTRPKKGRTQNKPKKCLTSQTSGSSSRTESCRSTFTVCSDGTTNL